MADTINFGENSRREKEKCLLEGGWRKIYVKKMGGVINNEYDALRAMKTLGSL